MNIIVLELLANFWCTPTLCSEKVNNYTTRQTYATSRPPIYDAMIAPNPNPQNYCMIHNTMRVQHNGDTIHQMRRFGVSSRQKNVMNLDHRPLVQL